MIMRGETDASVSVHVPVTASSHTLYADEEREMVKDVARRIAEGDLRARVLAKVAEQLETDEVQARLTKQVDDAQAATRKVRG